MTTQQYASALYQVAQEKDEKELDLVLERFFSLLKKNNDLSKIKDLVKKLKQINDKEEGIIRIDLESTYLLSDKEEEDLKIFFEKKLNAKKIIFNSQINKKILGGFRASYFKDGDNWIFKGDLKSGLTALEKVLE